MKQELARATARADGAVQAHESLQQRLRDLTEADRLAREARKSADRAQADAARALSRAEADRNLAAGKLETLGQAVARHEEEAMEARGRVQEAERAMGDLGDLDAARAGVEQIN